METENKNPAPEVNYSELLQIRRDKLATLKADGRDPFEKTSYPTDSYANEIQENFTEVAEGETGRIVAIAGRLMSRRIMGKASFAELRDSSGDIQVYIRRDVIGDDDYALYKKYDIGDIVGLKGEVFRTHMGEISV